MLRSVANLTRADAHEFLALAPQVPVRTTVEVHPLEQAETRARAPARGRRAGLGGAQRRASVSWLSVAPWPVIFAAPQRAASFTASSTVSQAARP